MSIDCENTFSHRNLLSYNQNLVITVFNTVIMLLTLTANTTIIVSLIKTKQLDSKVNRMFLGLSISDVCIAGVVQPLVMILFSLEKHNKNCKIELAAQFFSLLFGHSSAFLIVAIAIERLISVREFRARSDTSNISYTRTHTIISICFLVAFCISAAVTASSLHGKYLIASMLLKLVDFLSLMLVYTAYIETYRAVYQHVRSTQMLRHDNSSPLYATSMLKAIMLIVFFLFVCYMPYLSTGLVVLSENVMGGKKTSQLSAFLLFFTYEFVYLNSFFNAVIVLHKNRSLLQYVVQSARLYTKKSGPTVDKGNTCRPITLQDIQAKLDQKSSQL